MSLSAVPTDVHKVYDPRIDVLKQREYVITKGASKVSYIPYKSLSTGNSTMSFNIIPPSRNTFVDRKMFIETTISLNFSVNIPAGKTLDGGIIDPIKDAPRSFPLSRALASATATIGNTNVSMQTGDVIDALLRSPSIIHTIHNDRTVVLRLDCPLHKLSCILLHLLHSQKYLNKRYSRCFSAAFSACPLSLPQGWWLTFAKTFARSFFRISTKTYWLRQEPKKTSCARLADRIAA